MSTQTINTEPLDRLIGQVSSLAAIVRKLPAALKGAKTVGDLYATAAGRAWWEKHGVTIALRLEL